MSVLTMLARRYPNLNLQSIQLLSFIEQNPGWTIADIAEDWGQPHHHIYFLANMLAIGRGDRNMRCHGLLSIERDDLDRRRRNLVLTEAGEKLLLAIKPLIN